MILWLVSLFYNYTVNLLKHVTITTRASPFMEFKSNLEYLALKQQRKTSEINKVASILEYQLISFRAWIIIDTGLFTSINSLNKVVEI